MSSLSICINVCNRENCRKRWQHLSIFASFLQICTHYIFSFFFFLSILYHLKISFTFPFLSFNRIRQNIYVALMWQICIISASLIVSKTKLIASIPFDVYNQKYRNDNTKPNNMQNILFFLFLLQIFYSVIQMMWKMCSLNAFDA